MIKNYLKTVFRQAARSRLYTAINLVGLSVAIACCFVIFLFIANEYKYDRFHREGNKIYRVSTQETTEGQTRTFAHSYLPLASLLQTHVAGIKETVRLMPQSVSVANKE